MSELAKQLFDSLKAVKAAVLEVAPGLKDAVPEMKAEVARLGTQGTMEFASALFGGGAFVPYGPGQYTPDPSREQGTPANQVETAKEQPGHEQGRDR